MGQGARPSILPSKIYRPDRLLFCLIKANKIKIRVMFRQNTIRDRRLTREHIEQKYFILYYVFIKRGFGLDCSPKIPGGVRVRIYLARSRTQKSKLKVQIVLGSNVAAARVSSRGVKIIREDVAEVVSHDHDILQCLDIVLGAIHFKLNDLHKAIPEGKKRRRSERDQKKNFTSGVWEIVSTISGTRPGNAQRTRVGATPTDIGGLCRDHKIVLWSGSKRKKKRASGTP